MRTLTLLILTFIFCTCSTKSDSSRESLEINGFNYTDLYIDNFSVNGQGGGNVYVSSTTSGGGGSVCCIYWSKATRAPVVVTVEWTYDNTQLCRQEVTIEEPYPANPHHLGIHFFQDGHVEAALSEDYPELKLQLEHFDFEMRKETGNVMPRCLQDSVSAPYDSGQTTIPPPSSSNQ